MGRVSGKRDQCSGGVAKAPDTSIVGLFDPTNSRPGAVALQRQIDIIAFVVEDPGADDDEEIRTTAFLLGNPRTNGAILASGFPLLVPAERRNHLYRSSGNE